MSVALDDVFSIVNRCSLSKGLENSEDERDSGAVDRTRTGDLFLGKETLYQLSYYRGHRLLYTKTG